MKDRKPFFHSFAMAFFLICFGIALLCDLVHIIAGPGGFSWMGFLWFLLTAGSVAGLLYGSGASSRIRLAKARSSLVRTGEWAVAGALLLSGFILRLLVIRNIPIDPSSDFELYYHIASELIEGTLLPEHRDYISLYPHFLGFPSALSLVFRLFGTHVDTALYFNLFLQMLSCILVWRIARLLGGRISGLIALTCSVLMPSAVLYSSIVAAEPLFTFLLLTVIWMFLRIYHPFQRKSWSPWVRLIWPALTAGLLAYATSIRPMAVLFLVAAIICLLSVRESRAFVSSPSPTARSRVADSTAVKCLILVGVYCVASWGLSRQTARIIDREPAGASVSYGYNLLVGLNPESAGGWNQEDVDTLMDTLAATSSAHEAQRVCRDLALERLGDNWTSMPVLLAEKFDTLWGSDQFGTYWNEVFLNRQQQLTQGWSDFLKGMTTLSNLHYWLLLAGVVLYGVYRRRNTPDAGYVIVLLLCGTVALHLVLEAQNRYHYYALFLMSILAGIGFRQFSEQPDLILSRLRAIKKRTQTGGSRLTESE